MLIAITTISILAITGLVWLFNRILPFRICPICAGVSGTWLWILAGIYLGLLEAEGWKLIAAIAMGGSIVGIAYQIEKRLPSNRSPLLWKTLFVPAGFIAVYSAISAFAEDSADKSSWWTAFIVITTLLIIMALRFTEEPRSRAAKSDKAVHLERSRKVEELEKKMKNCC